MTRSSPDPQDDAPLASCLLVARAGGAGVRAAVADFGRQDYPARELVVIDATAEGGGELLPAAAAVRYERLAPHSDPLHARRRAVALSRGAFLAAWEEGLRSAPWRLSRQITGLLGSGRSVSVPAGGERGGLCVARSACDAVDWADGSDPTGRARLPRELAVDVVADPDMVGVKAADAGGGRPAAEQRPVASCIMPTFNRRAFVPRAVAYFAAQDLYGCELVIIDDGSDPIGSLLPPDPRVRYVHLPARASIGAKRNLACELARSDVLVQWDDDDWYSPGRLRHQVAPLLSGRADLTGIARSVLLDLRSFRFWACEAEATEAGIAAGTLAFTRATWEACRGYPDRSIGEDFALLDAAGAEGARVASLPNEGRYLYVRHRANAWRFDFDTGDGPEGWSEIEPPAYLAPDDLEFYAALAAGGARAQAR